MLIYQIEYHKIITEKVQFHKENGHFQILLWEGMATCRTQIDIIESDGFQLCYLLPGESVEIIPADQAVILSYIEFDLNKSETELFYSLPQPKGFYVPPNYSELAMMLKSIYVLFYAAD